MRLSQLQIKGFKSFADETIINFGEQVIGVVGPNGVGKSNIVDAIKWVLGEQKTKELRLESMQDVIFNGTKDRKRGKVARVTINFKNTKNILPTEYNDVSISRLLYRNGQSEYRLNDVPCRKKDITSLFLDSGLGSNAYAIISLSMVDDILIDRENSRSRMIEEASGINKFKVRKRETLNKLKSTQTDLDRVEDLLFELQTNLKTFEKQARRTTKYLKVKEEFKSISLTWASKNSARLKKDIFGLQSSLDSETARETELISALNQKEAALQKVKLNVLEKEGQLSEFQRKHNQLKDRISNLENKKGITQNEIKYLEIELKNHRNNGAVLAQDLSRLNGEQKSKSVEYSELEKSIKNLDLEYQGKLSTYNAVKEVYDSIRENMVSGLQQTKEFSTQIENTNRDISVKISQIDLLEGQFALKKTDEENIDNSIKLLSEKLVGIDNVIDNQRNELEKINNFLNDNIEAKDAQETALTDLQEQRQKTDLKSEKLKQRTELLESVITNYEGFTESIQFLSKENKLDHAVVTDILEIEKDEYQEIVEMYFAPYLQHLIVNNTNEAYELSKLVRGAQKGKINFLLSQDITAKAINSPRDNFTSLISILKYSTEYENIINSLAASVYIFDGHLDELLPQDIPDDVTILLPAEQLIYKKGRIKRRVSYSF